MNLVFHISEDGSELGIFYWYAQLAQAENSGWCKRLVLCAFHCRNHV